MIQTIDAPVSAPPELLDLIADFSRYLIRADRSPCTVRTYQWGLKDLAIFLLTRRIHNLTQLDRATLEAWQDRLIAVKLRPRSRSLATTAARQFLTWAADHDYCNLRVVRWLTAVHVKPRQPKPLPPASLAAVLDHYSRPDRPNSLLWLRDRALFHYLMATGARVSEALQVPRVGFEQVTVRQKGGTEKTLMISAHVAAIVQEYVQARTDTAPYLFINAVGPTTGQPLTPQGAREIWQRLGPELGIPPFTTHQLRHTFATECLERGVDSVTVAELLGHHGMQHIRNYAQVGPESRGRAMRAIDDAMHAPTTAPALDYAGEPVALDPRLTPRLAGQRGRPRFRAGAP